jgi:hypothetical protein
MPSHEGVRGTLEVETGADVGNVKHQRHEAGRFEAGLQHFDEVRVRVDDRLWRGCVHREAVEQPDAA